MKTKNFSLRAGFTIIELVMVLAIAGLIFLMVFVALPNIQRSQRDAQRRQDYAALVANMTAYMVNNNGKLPTVPDGGVWTFDSKKFVTSDGEDPGGAAYKLVLWNENNFTTYLGTSGASGITKNGVTVHIPPREPGEVFVVTGASCSDGEIVSASSKKAFAVFGYVELGNNTYCQDNGY